MAIAAGWKALSVFSCWCVGFSVPVVASFLSLHPLCAAVLDDEHSANIHEAVPRNLLV